MASTKVYAPNSELPTAMNEAAEDCKPTSDCVPGCFTCANGDKHAQLLTPSDEFLLIMQTHNEALRRGMANTKARIAVLKAERLDADLESGHEELRELNLVIHDYEYALEGTEYDVAHARGASMIRDHCDDEEEEEKEENESGDESEFAEDKDENVLDHLDSEYSPSHADFLAEKLADLLVKSETQEEEMEDDATPAQV
jgi:hypothetical protein